MLVAVRLGIGTPAFSLGGVLRSAHRHTVFSVQRVTCVPDLLGLSWFRHETTRTRNGSVSRETAVSVARVKPLCQLCQLCQLVSVQRLSNVQRVGFMCSIFVMSRTFVLSFVFIVRKVF